MAVLFCLKDSGHFGRVAEILCRPSPSQHHSFVAALCPKLLPLLQRFIRWGDRLLATTLTGIRVVIAGDLRAARGTGTTKYTA